MGNTIILKCPGCGGQVEATRLSCPACGIVIEGRFATSPFARLSGDQQEFVNIFLAARGNIKLVERQLGISYPTVRNRLRDVQQALGLTDLAEEDDRREDVLDVLKRVESGELSVEDAVDSLE